MPMKLTSMQNVVGRVAILLALGPAVAQAQPTAVLSDRWHLSRSGCARRHRLSRQGWTLTMFTRPEAILVPVDRSATE